MAEVKSLRRFYLHKRLEARIYQDSDLDTVWQAKQEAQPGSALAANFPHRSTLVSVGYTTSEDLKGADEEELIRASLTPRQAKDVIAAL